MKIFIIPSSELDSKYRDIQQFVQKVGLSGTNPCITWGLRGPIFALPGGFEDQSLYYLGFRGPFLVLPGGFGDQSLYYLGASGTNPCITWGFRGPILVLPGGFGDLFLYYLGVSGTNLCNLGLYNSS